MRGWPASSPRGPIGSCRSPERLKTHSIRHTAATWARKAEVPLDRISGILGHRDPEMVLRYAHIQPEDLDGTLGAVERAAARIGGRTVDEILILPKEKPE